MATLIINEIYVMNLSDNSNIFRWTWKDGYPFLGNSKDKVIGPTVFNNTSRGIFTNRVEGLEEEVRLPTPEEKRWFLACEKAGKFIPRDQVKSDEIINDYNIY